MSSGVVRLETDGSEVDEDYNKITWVFIGDKLMNCVIEFNEDQTVKSLIAKYGKVAKTPSGYEWYSDDSTVQFIFHKSSPNELMIIYLSGSYAFTPGK